MKIFGAVAEIHIKYTYIRIACLNVLDKYIDSVSERVIVKS